MNPTRRLLQNLWGMPAPKIGKDTKLAAFVEIGRGVTIGRNCSVQCFVSIPPGVTIGENVFIGPHVGFANHKDIKQRGAWTLSETIVEDDVSIGMGAMIGPGIRIGKGAVIGMGAIVVKDVAPGSTVVGNPARPIEDVKKQIESPTQSS